MSQAGVISNITGPVPPSVPTSFVTNNGTSVPVANVENIITANSTVKFAGASNTITQDFGLSNLLLGTSGPSISSGTQNTSLGQSALNAVSSGTANAADGYQSLQSLSTGSNNLAIGASSGSSLLTGSNNILIGKSSASAYVAAESSNIIIGNAGVAAENNVIRIGTQGTGSGQQSQAYVAGVLNTTSGRVVNVTNPAAYPYTTLITDFFVPIDTSLARSIVLIGSPVRGTMYRIKDNTGTAAANNITVSATGHLIDGVGSYVINNNYASADFIYNGSQWNVL